MKVFILSQLHPYQGEEILAAFSSQEKLDEYKATHRPPSRYANFEEHELTVDEWEVRDVRPE